MSKRTKRAFEKRGISVRCPVCGADPGERCRGATHAERKKRAAVFAERRVESVLIQRRLQQVRKASTEQERQNRRRNGPVRKFNVAELSPDERARYGL